MESVVLNEAKAPVCKALGEGAMVVLWKEALSANDCRYARDLFDRLERFPFPGLLDVKVVGTMVVLRYNPLPLSVASKKAEDSRISKGYREVKAYVEQLMAEEDT
jgi:hypothetical protein